MFWVMNKDTLYRLYIQENKSQKEISLELGISTGRVDYFLRKYQIKKPKELKNEKRKQTNLEKYGREYGFDYYKIKQTNLEKYGVENISQNKNIQEKRKQTCIKKYGYENARQSPDIKEKIKHTNNEKYGVDFGFQSNEVKDKISQTIKQKYGVNNISQLKDIQEKKQQTLDFNYPDKTIIVQKRQNTCEQKYGTKSFAQSKYCDWNTLQNKRYKTLKKNNSFNVSRDEEYIHQKLCGKFCLVKRQYKTDKYPFSCDFYIPEIDLYIEYQGCWTHGGIPFNPEDIQCLKKLNLWKDKHTKFYDNAIYTWTKLDVRKREIVKQNNLNWIEFFNLEEFENWFNFSYIS